MFKDVGDGMISMLVATKHSETGIKINGGVKKWKRAKVLFCGKWNMVRPVFYRHNFARHLL